MINRMFCSICGKELTIKLMKNISFRGKKYDVFYCERCMVGASFPAPLKGDLDVFYSSGNYRLSDGKRFNGLIESLIYLFRLSRKKMIERYCKKGRMLDIGCGRDLLLTLMKKSGWDVLGIEFDKDMAEKISISSGIQILHGNLEDYRLSDETFDVITAYHVLEHIEHPDRLINECQRLLKKNGLLVIAIPNLNSIQAILGKEQWFHLDVPYHIYHFSEQGIKLLIEKYGFDIKDIKQFSFEYNPFGWLQTMLNMSGIRKNFLYNILKKQDLQKDINAGIKDKILTFLLLPLYTPLAFILAVIEAILKKGGTIEIYAVKRGSLC